LPRAAAQEGAVEPEARVLAPSPMQAAREHMERAQTLCAAARYSECAEEFLRIYEAQPFAAFLYNAGVAYEKLGDPGQAADHFARYLQAEPQAQNAPELAQRIERLRAVARMREVDARGSAREQNQQAAAAELADSADAAQAQRAQTELAAARKRLSELEAQLAELDGRDAFKALLSVQSTPADAAITLKSADGELIEEHAGSPFSRSLDEGQYVIELRHPRYKAISTSLTVAPGKVYGVIVALSQEQFLGILRVVSAVPDASVYMDKREEGALGSTPFQNATPVGKHHLWIEKPGYKPIERDVDLAVGDDLLLQVTLERVDHGRVAVVANRPDAEVLLDGQALGRAPLELDVSPGAHELRVRAPDMKDWVGHVEVQRGQATPVRVRLRPKLGRAGAWVTAGVAAGALASGITTGVLGKHLEDNLARERDAGTLRSDDQRIQRGKRLYIAADVSYALSLALAGLATYYFLRDSLPNSEGRVLQPRDWTFHPSFSPSAAGGDLRMSF
jgi:hypothetical protein